MGALHYDLWNYSQPELTSRSDLLGGNQYFTLYNSAPPRSFAFKGLALLRRSGWLAEIYIFTTPQSPRRAENIGGLQVSRKPITYGDIQVSVLSRF